MPLELVCHACDVTLDADTEEKLADLAEQHSLSIHEHVPPRELLLARIRHHNL